MWAPTSDTQPHTTDARKTVSLSKPCSNTSRSPCVRKELELDAEPLTRAPKPRPVFAWARYGDVAVKVDAWAVAWTDHAVAIRRTTPNGEEHKSWVWASAVRPRRI